MSDMKIPKGKVGIAKSIAEMAKELNLKRMLEPSKVQQRLYHGTTATEGGKGEEAIRRIKPSKEGALGSGVYMTPNPSFSSSYAEGIGGNVLPVYSQIKNPLILEGRGDPMVEALMKLGMDEGKASRMVERAYENKGYIGKEVESRARAAGYDGLMQYRNGELAEVVSYNPNAIKSAIGNVGTYDTSVPDLNKAKGGAVKMRDGGDPVRAAIEQAVSSGKPRRPIALTPNPEWEREKYGLAKNLIGVSRGLDKYSVPVAEDIYEGEYVPKSVRPEIDAYKPSWKQSLGESVESGLKALGSPRPRAAALSDVMTGGREGSAISAIDLLPTPIYGQELGKSFGSALRKGNYGSAAIDAAEAALFALPIVAPATVKAGKAIAPTLGKTAEQYMMRTGMALPMDVWHGSPYRFPPTAKNPLGEFDPTKIGTGEGAQAYGHGFYLAEAPDVAKSYVPRDMKYEEKLLKMYQQAERSRNYDAMEVLESAMMHKTPKELMEQYPNQAGLVGKIKNIPYNAGALYKVDLPDEAIAKMLDWDKPLSQQAPEVQKALGALSTSTKDKAVRAVLSDPKSTGDEIHKALTWLGENKDIYSDRANVTNILREQGIPGIRYLDGGSRGAGQGTSNFVVFPGMEDILTIKERMKKGGAVRKAGGGIARRLAKYAKSFEPSKKTEIFIGEKSKIWDAPAAAKAVQLEKAGVDPVDIWRQTGTFRSPDGKLRQEISDDTSLFRNEAVMKEFAASLKQQEADIKAKIAESKLHPDLFPKQLREAQKGQRDLAKEIKAKRTMQGGPETGVHIGNRAEFVLEHPELYKAYPELAGIDVAQGGVSGGSRGAFFGGSMGHPGNINIYRDGLSRDPQSTMLHEMQHAVQGLEGFGAGGNPTMAFMHPEAHEILNKMRKQALEPMSYEDYAKKAGLDSLPLGDAMAEYEKYKKNIPIIAKKLDRDFQNEAAQLFYTRLAGEAESRAVQERMLMTPSQRKETFPLSSYDVLPEDVITKFEKKKGGPVSLDAMRLAVGGMAEGGIKASPTKPGQEFLGNMGKAAEKLGIKIEEAMKIVSQEGNSPIKAALINFLISDTLKYAGTALQDWTGTPRDATEKFPYRRLMTGKGMTAQFDPRLIDVAPIAGSVARRVASGIKHLPTDIMMAATAAYGPQATASYMSPAKKLGMSKFFPGKTYESLNSAEKSALTRFENEMKNPAVRRREAFSGPTIIEATDAVPEAKIVSPEEILKYPLMPLTGDVSGAGYRIKQIAGIPLKEPVDVQGGFKFSLIHELLDNLGWASMSTAAKKKVLQAYEIAQETGQQPLAVFVAMTPESINFSTPVVESLLGQLQAIKPSKDAIKALNKAIKEPFGTYRERPDFVGIESPDIIAQLRGEGDFSKEGAGDLRKKVVELMSQAKYRKMGFPRYDDVSDAIIDESLKGAERGLSGSVIFRTDPNAQLVSDPNIINHFSYDTGIPRDVNFPVVQLKDPIGAPVLFEDIFKQGMTKGFPLSEADIKKGKIRRGLTSDEVLGALMMRNDLVQMPSQEHMDRVMNYMRKNFPESNYKKGGPVYKSSGGILKSLNAMRAFIKASKEADIAKKSKEAVAKGEVYIPDEETKRIMQEALKPGMPEKPEGFADGGQITSDDLIIEERAL